MFIWPRVYTMVVLYALNAGPMVLVAISLCLRLCISQVTLERAREVKALRGNLAPCTHSTYSICVGCDGFYFFFC